ncbi:hypothetical protein ACHAXA_002448 [Cyclostephanos tholiformis]|uniref:Carbohydrate-binding module family 96 domain-containing protein n=1 Tax=Cyclostephanos tholiformis TaxID=382380 RepID=A0ABD3RCS3_9STRA
MPSLPPSQTPQRHGLHRDAADSNEDNNQHSVQSQSQEVTGQESKVMFREWQRDNGYEKLDDEFVGDDPLASPGNSSLNSGHFGGWSLTEGIAEKESIGIPFNEDDDEYNEKKGRNSQRTSSPRESQFKTHGLCMVKEENCDDLKSPGGVTTFDDVDLEASPTNLSTANKDHCNRNRGRNRLLEYRGKITDRVLQELQTNPKLKYKVMVAFTVMVALTFLLGVVIAASSENKQSKHNDESRAMDLNKLLGEVMPNLTMSNATSSSPKTKPTVKPTIKATTAPSLEPTHMPTFNPTMYLTSSKTTLSPSDITEQLNTLIPSISPTSALPTPLPSTSPMTMAPTRDCTDSPGEFTTYNDKSRTCEWLDNGHNGARSTRKDLDCLTSELGDACKYTCRLYNGCMDYLLSSFSYFTNENNVSFGDPCADKDGSFISNGNEPRECSWLDEDPETAPAKKNENCGTKDIPRTELGLMCPASCAGYNDCKQASDGSSVERVSPHPLSVLDDQADEPDEPTINCHDKEGKFLTHRGTYRKCRWLNQDDSDNAKEKKELNCGITEIGMNCLETCPCDIFQEEFDETPTATPTMLPTLQPTLTGDAAAVELTEDLMNTVLNGATNAVDSSMAALMDGWTDDAADTPTLIPTLQPTSSHDATADALAKELMGRFKSKKLDENLVGGDDDSDFAKREEPVVQGEAAAIFYAGVPTFSPVTEAPTPHPDSRGVFNDSGDILTLTVFADASVSQKEGDVNFGADERLNVENDLDRGTQQRQSLLLFDLTFVAESFKKTFGRATLRIYLVIGSDSGGVNLKKMTYTNWTEHDITWNTIPGGDGLDEPLISFVDSLNSASWYDIDATAPVREALESGESRLGIRIVSDDDVDVYFASKERGKKLQPLLIIDSRTIDPTVEPTKGPFDYPPTQTPTSSSPTTTSPIVALDCLDKKGKFVTPSGESQPCSWLNVGDESSKKEINCQNQNEAAFFCQASCSAHNGCDDMHCMDMSGMYVTHTGWTAECDWLLTGQGDLKLELNCGGTPEYPITELGKRCQATCGDYNGCNTAT